MSKIFLRNFGGFGWGEQVKKSESMLAGILSDHPMIIFLLRRRLNRRYPNRWRRPC
jgi:hypothetical protein